MSQTRVSNSSFSTLVDCETRFVVEYVQGYSAERESAITVAGSAAHEAWAAYFRGYSAKSALNIFREKYEPFADDPENFIEERMSFDNVYANLSQWFNRNPWAKLPFIPDPELVEIPIEMPLDENGDVLFIAVLDLLPMTKDQSTHLVVDNKTTRAMTEWFERKFINGSQITGYIAAARFFLNDDTINQAYINGLVLKKLNRSYVKCAKHKMQYAECWPEHVDMRILGPYERTHEQIQDWKRTAVKLARRFPYYYDRYGGELTQELIKTLNVNGAFKDSCRFCSFERWCASGRQAHALDRMFQKRSKKGLRSGVFDDDSQ